MGESTCTTPYIAGNNTPDLYCFGDRTIKDAEARL